MTFPSDVVVDTNVAVIANGRHGGASTGCVAASASALERVMRAGKVYVDDGGEIVQEYRSNLAASGQPGPGDAFLKWILTHEWSGQKVVRVALTPKTCDPTDYEELPAPPIDVRYDPSDRKFLAVSTAHPRRPCLLQALDSKWWGWREALGRHGVSIRFICEEDAEKKYQEKMRQ